MWEHCDIFVRNMRCNGVHRTILILVSLLSFAADVYPQLKFSLPESPCPHLFRYKYDGTKWIGEIEVPSPSIYHSEAILHVVLSLRAVTSPDNIGTLTIVGTSRTVSQQIINREPLKFIVHFPRGTLVIPKLVSINFDGNHLCTGSEEPLNAETPISRLELKHVTKTFPISSANSPFGYEQANPTFAGQFATVNYPLSNPVNNVPVASVNKFPTAPVSNFPVTNFPVTNFPAAPVNNFPVAPAVGFPSTIQGSFSSIPSFPPPSPLATRKTSPSRLTTPRLTTPWPTTPWPTTTAMASTTNSPNQNVYSDTTSICGTRYAESEVTPLIFGGEDTQRGDWPWVVAVYLNKPTGLLFNCGGSLISPKTVLTAAHCIVTKTGLRYRARDLYLSIGRHSLVDWGEIGAVSTNVDSLLVHAEYKRSRKSFDADIAILITAKLIEFNEFVRPVCLWPETTTSSDIEGKTGVVVGWGKDGSDRVVSDVAKKVDLPIVDTLTCIQHTATLTLIVSNRTFCAGSEGEGPCHGDSGGGMFLYYNGRWTLRGLVSTGLSDPNTGICRLTEYVVFTDIPRFFSWIKQHSQF